MKNVSISQLYKSALYLLVLTSCYTTSAQSYGLLRSTGTAGAVTITSRQIINDYYHVSLIDTASTSPSMIYYRGTPVSVGDKVLLIQMTGASAGQWLIDSVAVSIASVSSPNTILLSHTYLSSYGFDPIGGQVQLVKMPQYASLHIAASGTLTALPWNDSTGGVLAYLVRDTLRIDQGGVCDVTGLGFSAGSVGGLGDIGGSGGIGGTIGQHGGDTGIVVGSGVGGGGDGGLYGQAAPRTSTIPALSCPGCGVPAANLTQLSHAVLQSKLLMGGAGQGGIGGAGGRGAGGGGGGAGTGAQNGSTGGNGGHGGNGSAGGAGGGIMIAVAGDIVVPSGQPVMVADGVTPSVADSGTHGGTGGQGGNGSGSCIGGGGPGGGGGGADGGDGGDGGSGGSGGLVYALMFHLSPSFTASSYSTVGGTGSDGGIGGDAGDGGINGVDTSGVNCGGTLAGSGQSGHHGKKGASGTGGAAGGGGSGDGVLLVDCSGNQTIDLRVDTICGGGSYTLGTHVYTTAGMYTDSSYSILGCDSFTILTLAVVSGYSTSINQTICAGSSYLFNGNSYSAAGTYTDTLHSVGGCDSIVTLTLNVALPVSISITQTICGNEPIVFGGQPVVVSGTYIDTLVSQSGCDSIVALYLTVLPISDSSMSRTICSRDTILFGGRLVSAAGIYIDTLVNAVGCDSIVTLALSHFPQPVAGFVLVPYGDTIELGTMTLTDSSVHADSTYWQLNGLPIHLETGDILPILTAGDYCIGLHIVSPDGCVDSSIHCVYVYQDSLYMPNAFTPNNDNNNDYLMMTGTKASMKSVSISIFNKLGEKVFASFDENFQWDGSFRGTIQDPGVYTYLLNITFINRTEKHLRGTVTIIR
jgi:gliding motility-associated-like protein